MKRIVLFEHTDILSHKINKILNGFHLMDVLILKNYTPIGKEMMKEVARSSCIIVDLDNRNQDGIVLVKYLKANKATKDIPVITISGNVNLITLKKAIKAGCNDFILKPFETEILINKIYKVCYIEENAQKKEKEYHLGELFQDSAITLKWTRDFEIGVEQIDIEHRNIIENYDKLYTMMQIGQAHAYYRELLDFLEEYVNTHFEHEEQLQLRIHYDRFDAHKEHHDKFKARLYNILKEHSKEEISRGDLISISLFIKDWLLHHILIEDMNIREFLTAK